MMPEETTQTIVSFYPQWEGEGTPESVSFLIPDWEMKLLLDKTETDLRNWVKYNKKIDPDLYQILKTQTLPKKIKMYFVYSGPRY